MSYTIKHKLQDKQGLVSVVENGEWSTVRYSVSGTFKVLFAGKLNVMKIARYSKHVFVTGPPRPVGQPAGPGRWNTEECSIPLTMEIKTPDGKLFTSDHVTLDDLKKFRDLRGTTIGLWTYKIQGESAPIPIIHELSRVTAGKTRIQIWVEETLASKSAVPLVKDTLKTPGVKSYAFDLYRTGTFTATAKSIASPFPVVTSRKMKLIDPDGIVIATSTNGKLTYPVTLRTLNKSRDVSGKIRKWSLEVLPASGPPRSANTAVWATVIETSVIHTSVLQDRIHSLIGENGNKLSIYGEEKKSNLLARLKILDEISAETIDMHGLLDSVIKDEQQDSGIDTEDLDIKKDIVYTIASRTRDLGNGFRVALNGLKIKSINISLGASEKILPATPALKIDVHIEGHATVNLKGFPLATIKVANNRIKAEAGMRLSSEGVFSSETWIDEDLLDIDVHWAAAMAAGIISGGMLLLGALGVAEFIESILNKSISDGFASVLSGSMAKVPQILSVIHGDVFTYTSLRLDGDDLVFDYIAPLEPEPKPNKSYRGIIGRSATQMGPKIWQVMPRTMGDTWKADNLGKIDHVVVVMMENRSFDHVLGYRAQLPGHHDSDGLTTELVSFLNGEGFPITKLSDSGIEENAQGFKTKFPASVGHEFEDVAEQLEHKLTVPGSNRKINSPEGFVSNFTGRAAGHPELKVTDVLGYYVASDLPFFKYLAENYAYCEKFFCSHPGPTLPNRMFSLTGDLQYDRMGEALLNNNNRSNFYLSRASTIYDLLSKKGVSWRVYESNPSVTMLRMFARYATDNTNIVKIDRLQQDVTDGNLPALTIVEPAMHHYPENDDHSPDADMYNGQLFLKGVYDTLRSNDALWRKTMLIITYDEHGGFYDHVIPPIADVRIRENVISQAIEPGSQPDASIPGSHFTPESVRTDYGVRVPTFVVSPWTKAGKGPDIVLDFCSILKTVVARFCGTERPFVSDRVDASRSFESYLSETQARMVPDPPDMTPLLPEDQMRARPIKTKPISRKQMESGNVDYHALSGMIARMLGR